MGRKLPALVARLRIDRAGSAYCLCCFLSTALVAAAFLPIVAWNLTRYGAWSQFDLPPFILRGIEAWFALSIFGMILALPFVPAATWVGARLRIENGYYYFSVGGLTVCVLVFFLFGPPRETDFGSVIFAWIIGPACGAAWGGSWWFIHRRWIVRAKQKRDANA